MAQVLSPRDTVGRFQIIKELNKGALAISYKAKDERGALVFLKQYKSPSVRKPWYKAYIAYQATMKARIETSGFKNFTYRFIDFFEHARCYFQVFEFVPSESLQEHLLAAGPGTARLTWERRLTMAQVMMGGIKFMHQTNIVHSDLKPGNVILIPVKEGGYRLKLIDMDFSLLADRRAPWHGDQGYFGTPGYVSPEHKRGEVPTAASDVFTCGLILYELLAGRHAFEYTTEDEYTEAMVNYRALPPRLLGSMEAGNDAEVIELLHRCINPDPLARPTAALLHVALCKRGRALASSEPAAHEVKEESSTGASPPGPEPVGGRVLLRGVRGDLGSFGVETEIGRRICGKFGEDAQYWSDPQFRLEKSGGRWFVVPSTAATNPTLLNGKSLTERRPLNAGDELSVGNEEKALVKLPFTVAFTST